MKQKTFFFWCDFAVMTAIPLILLIAKKYYLTAILKEAELLAVVWLLSAMIFLIFSIFLAFRAKDIFLTKDQKTQIRQNLNDIILVAVGACLGAAIFLTKVFSTMSNFWDIAILYWILFILVLVKINQRLLGEYLSEA
ncbi:MAG: hypothetical protein ABIJ41_02815 [Candidatus Omnitrophota bacterium]